MNYNDTNEFGCPIRYQTGEAAIYQFTTIIAQLPADLRIAFEIERKQRQAEFDTYIAVAEYRT